MIDLHLHTTASDGRRTPAELVHWASVAGVTVMAVTDHDTTAAIAEVRTAAARRGIETVSGIEITAIEGGRDIHMLGYFFDAEHAGLATFLADQRKARVARAEAIAATLATLGKPIRPACRTVVAEEIDRPIDWPAAARAGDGHGRPRGRLA